MPLGSLYPPDVPALTVTTAVAEAPPALAVTVAEPAATAVTSPVDETVATLALLLVHDTPTVRGFPLASRGVAVSCHVSPGTMVTVLGLIDMDATTCVATLTVAVPL
jgi:hypothetical protein